MRMTRQRVIILQALCELDGHASAEQLFRRVTLHRRDVDLSTVYRTLERLCDLRIVSETNLGRGHAEFELMSSKPHHHLVCRRCEQTLEVDHASLAPVAEIIRQDTGFEPDLDHLAIFGLCPECQEEQEST
jgi:Fur family ferric uptake transcriptional regulator